ncbi:unnamed protein product, partial [Polarella glacialis]
NGSRRTLLTLSNLGPRTLYSVGAGASSEKDFFGLLVSRGILVLYDFRSTNFRDEVRFSQPHFEVRKLKSACRSRLIEYRHVPVGKESAHGILKHLPSDEVQHILVELVWRAKHTGPTAFLGHQLDWRADHRLVVSDELTRHGHRVEHVVAPDTSEVHQKMAEVPYFILQEETQLKKMEASRKSGERPPVRSKTDRSTEAVVRSLATQKVSVDVGGELRDAENQTDLNRIQKRMVRLQVAQNKKEGGLASKELTSLPSYIVAEAQEKLASHEVKKAAYEARKKAVEIDPMSKSSASSAQPDPSHALLVASDSAASSSSHHVAPTLASAREGIAAVSEATSTRSSTWRTARLARALNCSDGGEEDAGQSELPENLTAPEAASSAVSEPSSRRSRWSGVKRTDGPAG